MSMKVFTVSLQIKTISLLHGVVLVHFSGSSKLIAGDVYNTTSATSTDTAASGGPQSQGTWSNSNQTTYGIGSGSKSTSKPHLSWIGGQTSSTGSPPPQTGQKSDRIHPTATTSWNSPPPDSNWGSSTYWPYPTCTTHCPTCPTTTVTVTSTVSCPVCPEGWTITLVEECLTLPTNWNELVPVTTRTVTEECECEEQGGTTTYTVTEPCGPISPTEECTTTETPCETATIEPTEECTTIETPCETIEPTEDCETTVAPTSECETIAPTSTECETIAPTTCTTSAVFTGSASKLTLPRGLIGVGLFVYYLVF